MAMATEARHDANRRLLRARDAMDRSYADAMDIEALARFVHLSRAHFIRTFRETFGETPHRYLQRRRLERAMRLLRETDIPVTEICLDVGFTSLGTFSRTFHEIVGTSPRAYRERGRPRRARRSVPACPAAWRPNGTGHRALSEKTVVTGATRLRACSRH